LPVAVAMKKPDGTVVTYQPSGVVVSMKQEFIRIQDIDGIPAAATAYCEIGPFDMDSPVFKDATHIIVAMPVGEYLKMFDDDVDSQLLTSPWRGRTIIGPDSGPAHATRGATGQIVHCDQWIVYHEAVLPRKDE